VSIVVRCRWKRVEIYTARLTVRGLRGFEHLKPPIRILLSEPGKCRDDLARRGRDRPNLSIAPDREDRVPRAVEWRTERLPSAAATGNRGDTCCVTIN
jgi:hypothetical protein